MKKILRSFLPQMIINYFYHLPLAVLANLIYGFPSKNLTVVGVTGTDGKTTTVNMIYQILKVDSKKVSMVSTINSPGLHVTSPDPMAVQKLIKDAVDNSSSHMVLEVTSHALDQFRFWGTKFDIGVITNITHEHLDYHKTFGSYKNAKVKLLKGVKWAIVNGDLKIPGSITFGLDEGDFNSHNFPIKLSVPGEFNILNALAAAAVCSKLGVDNETIKRALSTFQSLPGRMEEIKNNLEIKIVVDFAHTPNGLESSLITLRIQASPGMRGRVISVIGAEGFRDIGKRSMMGEIAQKLSDIVVVTAVDPRGQLTQINKQIMVGSKKAGGVENKNLFVINDRRDAIKWAIENAEKGDTVGIFGKGHEKSMNLDGKVEIPWSDQEIIKKILKNGR